MGGGTRSRAAHPLHTMAYDSTYGDTLILPTEKVLLTMSDRALDWSFPSPTATPTNAAFNPHLQTPKTTTFPSHFQDAFSTPQVPGYATPQQQPYPFNTPLQRPQSSSETLRLNFYANVQASGGQVVHPGVQNSEPLGNSNPSRPGSFQMSPSYDMAMQSFNSSQMQTPPPTRGTSARKLQQTQIAFGTPTTIATNKYATPQQPFGYPSQLPQPQCSPAVYPFAAAGPVSMQSMPQSQLSFDTGNLGYYQQPSFDDPFAPAMNPEMSWSGVPGPQFEAQYMNMTGYVPHNLVPRSASSVTLPAEMVPMHSGNAGTASLDPSLIYSSPVRPISRSASRLHKRRSDKHLDGKRKDSGSPAHELAKSASPTETSATDLASRELRRSSTTPYSNSKNVHPSTSTAEILGRSHSFTQVPRTASPLKRISKMPLGSISERKPASKPSVVLTVDANGMARAETRPAEPSPTKSIQERYPGLFDEDTSDDESVTDEAPPSRSASFTFAKGDERRMKAARLDPPLENLEGLSIPRSSSSTSMRSVTPSRAAISAAAQLRRQSSLRKLTRPSPIKLGAMTRSTSSLIDSCPMNMAQEPQVSSGAGRHVTENAGSVPFVGQARAPATALDAHNRRWSMMSSEQNPHPSQISPHHYSHYMAAQQRRPPQELVARPPQIRCICGVVQDQSQVMIQCVSCTSWLHTVCVGLDRQPLPSGFTCFLCTKPVGGFVATTR